MSQCPTCGARRSRWMSLVELAEQMQEPDARPVTKETLRARGRKIAEALDLPIVTLGGLAFVATADVDRAARVEVAS